MHGEPLSSKTYVPPQVVDAALHSWGESGRQSTFTVIGQSMEPFLFAGDELLIVHGKEDIHVGGLIAYRKGHSLVVHRLLRMVRVSGEPLMQLQGDNNDRPDPPVQPDRLVGRVVAVRRGGRSYALETPLWRGASRLIAACYRRPITLGQWAGTARRKISPDRTVSGFGRPYRLALRVCAIPARLLTFVLWKFARYDRVA